MSKKLYIKVGSDKSNDLVVKDVDPFHLELFRDNLGNVFISDLKTKSGTRVNSRRLDDYTQLKENDRVYLAENILFDWQKAIQHFDPERSKPTTKKAKTKPENKKKKSVTRDYIELVLIYGSIGLMVWLISLWL
jgi:pSer/pThr/pTyr-binding forkhead associated (FHA) protein